MKNTDEESQARDAAFTQVFQMNMHEDDMDGNSWRSF